MMYKGHCDARSLISGLLFTIMGVVQLTRLLSGWVVEINGMEISTAWSGFFAVLALGMGIWNLWCCRCRHYHEPHHGERCCCCGPSKEYKEEHPSHK